MATKTARSPTVQSATAPRSDQMDIVISKLEKLAHNGVFGPGDVVAVESNSTDGKGAQFASQLFFARVVLKTDETREVPVVVKLSLTGDERELMGTDIQFANEVTMYKKILPKLHTAERGIHPKMLFGSATAGESPEEDIIVIEDLRPLGYKVPKTVFVDHHHVSLAVRKLGEYHGLSYKTKRQSPTALKELAKELHEPYTVDGGSFFKGAILRGFKPLIEKHPNGIAKKAHEKLAQFSSIELYKILKKPEEPFAVITHGDYNVNNLLFAYDDDGKVTDIKFIDFATSLYSDPAVDLAFFLYMNTSPETRDEYWDEFLRIYWEGVVSVEASPGFVYEEFLDHFAVRAIYGYLPCSFFLPMMLFPDVPSPPASEFSKFTEGEKMRWGLENYGVKATEATSSIIHHLLDKGYLEKFVNEFDFS